MSIVRVRPVTRALVYVGAAWIIAWIGLTHLVTPPGGGTPGLAPARPATPDLGALRSLPLVAQSAISGTVGTTAPRFAARRSGAGWQLRGGGVRAWFGAGPVRFSAGGGSAAMTATGASGRWTADGNRVSRANGWLREWYAAGPFGIEQGFTVAHRPAAAGASRELTLAVAVGGSLRAQAAGSSIDFLRSGHDIAARYGGVTAVDATGRHLPASLRVRDGRVLITVDDRGARYPLTIDPLIQQGGKLTAGGESGPGSVGVSVALSADGNTALVGGDSDNGNNGAAWVFTRSGGTWSQQGAKLTGGGATAGAGFGSSVALSADGNTALIGGDFDGATGAGAAWVFTRSGSTWTQQGAKLTGPGATSGAGFGTSVALSASGNTALVGGPTNGAGDAGAAWAFSRSGSTWSALGSTLVATGESAAGEFGNSVALSADGVTALIGASNNNSQQGAAWVFVLGGSGFAQQARLTPSDEGGNGGFGTSVALSSDGNTALIGGPADGTGGQAGEGAAWVFTRTQAIWSQQGAKLTASDAGAGSGMGSGVALSSDGAIALIGGQGDAGGVGAAWLFARSGATWTQQASKLTGQGEVLVGTFGYSVALSADGRTAVIGGKNDNGGAGAAWAFAPPAPACATTEAATPAGGGAVTVALPCSGPAGAALSYAIVSGPAHGSLGPLSASGLVRYSSASGYVGPDAFTYRATDQWGVSTIATASIAVPSFPAPTCVNVSARGRRGATKVTVTLTCHGPAGVPFTYRIVTPPGDGKVGQVNQSHGTVTYTTHVGFSGTDRFTYRATNAGGPSASATATIVLPALGRITSTMTWGAFRPGASATVLPGMLVKGLPGAATVRLSCTGRGCPIKTQTVSLAKQRVCTGKGKKRRCTRAVPASGNLDLTHLVANRRVRAGSALVVAMIQPGSIGKEYVFGMVRGKQPSVKIRALAPGGTAPCPGC